MKLKLVVNYEAASNHTDGRGLVLFLFHLFLIKEVEGGGVVRNMITEALHPFHNGAVKKSAKQCILLFFIYYCYRCGSSKSTENKYSVRTVVRE